MFISTPFDTATCTCGPTNPWLPFITAVNPFPCCVFWLPLLLYLYTIKRYKYGDFELHKPSRFLQDLPDELASRIQQADDLIPRMDESAQRAAFESVLDDLRRKMKQKGFFRSEDF